MKRLSFFAVILAVMMLLSTAGAVTADPPAFTFTIAFTGDTEIETGQSTLLTADWTTNRDVTRYEWSVNGVGQGEVAITGAQSGSQQFNFTDAPAGVYVISFSLWHHTQSGRDASASITVTVTDPVNNPEYKNHGQYVKSVAQGTESGPGKGQIVAEAAKSDTGKKSR